MPIQDFQTVIVPLAGDDRDIETVSLACSLYRTKETRRTVIALRVVEIDRSLPINADLSQEVNAANAMIEDIRQKTMDLFKLNECDFVADVRQARVIGSAIIEDAEEFKADLIVMSLKAGQELGEYSMGSIVPYVLENAKCRIIVDQESVSKE